MGPVVRAVETVTVSLLVACEFILFLRVILSWMVALRQDWTPRGPVLVVSEFVYTVTDPPLRWIRRLVKPIRLGGVALDLSMLVLFFVLFMVVYAVQMLFVYWA